MAKNLVYAVDFGTSNSLLAASNSGEALGPIDIDLGSSEKSILRSLMYFPVDGDPQFGEGAIKGYLDESGEGRFIRSIKKYLPMESFRGTQINGAFYRLEDLVGRFLREMKRRGDDHFSEDVTKIVLGRPAKFSDTESKDTLAESRLRKAAELAGFKEVQFFPEPLAAAYSYKKELSSEKLVLVVDLGGGTSDFTVIKIGPGQYSPQDVLSIGGISVAGDALDGCIMANKIAPHFGSEVKYKFPISSSFLTMPATIKYNLSSPADITLMARSGIMNFLNDVKKSTVNACDIAYVDQLFRLINGNLGFSIFEKIEKCKRGLSENESHLFKFDEDKILIEEEITSDEFKSFTQEKIASIFKTLDNVLASAGVKPQQIDSICCTGGTSKVSVVKAGLIERFGEEKIHSFRNFHSVIDGLSEKAAEWD